MNKYQEAMYDMIANFDINDIYLEDGDEWIDTRINLSKRKIIQELIDKQTPGKPHYVEKYGHIDLGCPACDEFIGITIKNYCDKCGKKLDWSSYETQTQLE